MRMVLAALAFVAGPALATGVSEEPPFAGIWAAEPAWCKYADRIGSHSPAPIRLTSRSLDGYENSCFIRQIDPMGEMKVWRLRMECQAEGSTYDEDTLVMLESKNVLWRFWGTGAPVKFVRCKT